MKKLTLVLMTAAIMMFAAVPLFAEGMMLGAKGGLNIATLIGDDVEDAASKMGLVAGGFFCYNITEIFAIQPELLFTMKGAKSDDNDDVLKINYIEIPLLLKVNLPTEGKIDPMLYAGPGFGILMSCKATNGEEQDWKDVTKTLDIGIIAGAGVAYQMERGALILEARYEIGMSTIDDWDDAMLENQGLTEQPDEKNSVISIMAGYAFSF